MESIIKNRDKLINLMANYIDVYVAIGESDKARRFIYIRRLLLMLSSSSSPSPSLQTKLMNDDIVKEFCETGKSHKLTNLLGDKKVRSLISLCGVMGIGPVTAGKLYNEYNITSVDDLRAASEGAAKAIKLTATQKLGIKYHHDLSQRIPRQEVEDIYKHLCPSFVPYETIILGSYRRGAITSGDIDILISGGGNGGGNNIAISKISKKLIEFCGKRLVAIISRGLQKMTFLYHSHISGLVRHIDLFYAKKKQYIPYLLYGTGSAEHNEMMRGIAKEKGFKLNQLGLFYCGGTRDGSQRILHEEGDLYKILGVKYIPPNKR